jgi:hypothetical protein
VSWGISGLFGGRRVDGLPAKSLIVPSSPFNFVETFADDGEPLVRFFFATGFLAVGFFAVVFFATEFFGLAICLLSFVFNR